ncbi:MAG: peptidoglycan bridge formation glycyltransferase FemA/FemB family protein [Patescibacteria group bacterium]
MTDLRQTPRYAKYMQSIGWHVEKNAGVYCFSKQIPILGKFIKVQRPKNITPSLFRNLEKKKAFKIILEPDLTSAAQTQSNHKLLSSNNFTKSNSPYLPSKTIHIDLKLTEEALLKQMKAKTRYNIKIAKRNGVIIKKSTDITAFAIFWSKNVEGSIFNFWSQKENIVKMYKAFDKKTDLLIAYKNGEMLAGILMPQTQEIAYYMYAAASKKGKKLHAPTLITWEAIKLAKKKKLKTFDFEGIYDERFPLKSWLGFSKFKKTFGGKEIEYPGCFTKTYFRFTIGK